MAKSIIWSQESLDDIASIAEFISRDSIHHAQRVVDEIFTITEILLIQPKIGRIVPELAEEQIREHFIYSYRIIYEIS
jgi:plasmid stabilization system protein ParE